ncbi:hypothetical protein [Roseobacter sp. S98]|uniref:hypothetical protein n=1 Tax=Roseobacter algicola (ex Choi et al. 2025) (nom. illeg.) TaxID=3092138 RepID=UPI003F519B73
MAPRKKNTKAEKPAKASTDDQQAAGNVTQKAAGDAPAATPEDKAKGADSAAAAPDPAAVTPPDAGAADTAPAAPEAAPASDTTHAPQESDVAAAETAVAAEPPVGSPDMRGPENLEVTVVGPKKGRWRCGRHFTKEPVTINASELTHAEFTLLQDDPRLIVSVTELRET